jgi:hypothetical protein
MNPGAGLNCNRSIVAADIRAAWRLSQVFSAADRNRIERLVERIRRLPVGKVDTAAPVPSDDSSFKAASRLAASSGYMWICGGRLGLETSFNLGCSRQAITPANNAAAGPSHQLLCYYAPILEIRPRRSFPPLELFRGRVALASFPHE